MDGKIAKRAKTQSMSPSGLIKGDLKVLVGPVTLISVIHMKTKSLFLSLQSNCCACLEIKAVIRILSIP